MKLKYYVSILIMCFVVTSCLTTTHDEHRNFGDGSKVSKVDNLLSRTNVIRYL